ncbi:MAG: ABC transporter permease, partial [Actinomycetia bacterium]|nr:ABC transporter permease [Actinomycetes bacterium]
VIVGTLASMALAGLGMAVSSFSKSNRASLGISLVTLLILAAPGQLPPSSTRGLLGDILVRSNPMAAGLRLNTRILIDERTWSSQWTLLIAPVIFAVVMIGIAIASWRRVGMGYQR